MNPDYPEQAKQHNQQGSVVVAVTIGPSGTPLRSWVFLSSKSQLLDKAALEAARKSLYTEPQVNGSPVVETVLVDYGFELE